MATYRLRPRLASERGAVLVHVAIALLGLTAFSAFVIDFGVMWVARRQAQNAADAAALAGAISLAYVDFDDHPLAIQSALAVAGQNQVWGEAPDVKPTDITFPPCPAGSPGVGTNSCIRVDVFRNQLRGNPLPTFFARLVGIDEQGVRATATAEALFGNSTNCVKPFAIPDKWQENNDTPANGWDETDTFERYVQKGKNKGELISTPEVPDAYPSGSGYSPKSVSLGGGDYGRYVTLKNRAPHDSILPGWFQIVRISGTGGDDERDDIATCNPRVIGPGTVLVREMGDKVGPTSQGMEALIALDRFADWDPTLYDGRGGVKGGCMVDGNCVGPGGPSISPRLVAIPVYDPDAFNLLTATTAKREDAKELHIVRVVGFFLDKMEGKDDVGGWITTYPAEANAGMGGVPGNDFVVSVALVR